MKNMKKLLGILLALVLVFSLAACGSNGDKNSSESGNDGETLVYKYEESHGSFSINWTIELKADGTFQITEVNGMSGGVAIHTGGSWKDNGNNTFTTGEWDDKDVDKSYFFAPTGECTWIITGDGTCKPENEDENAGSGDGIQPGKYVYEEDRGDFIITWAVMLNGNGSFTLEETHGLSGQVTNHTGSGWTDNGDGTVTTGEWDNKDVDKSEFFKPTGECTWKINDDGTCEPVGGGEGSGGKAGAVNPGKYTYVEDKGPIQFTWEVLLMGNGNCRIDETGPNGETIEHEADGWIDNGDGTVTTGEWTNKDVDKSEFFKPTGECTWKINEDGTCEPVSGESGGSGNAVNPGKYTYVEDRGPIQITWEVLLMGNGNCRIDETTPSGEVIEHEAAGWTDNGNGYVTTGEWTNKDVNKSDFFAPTGECTWKILDSATCVPAADGEGEGQDAGGAVNPGKYTYVEDKGPIQFTWEVLLMGNGNCRIDETGPNGETIEHEAAGWTDNGDGTVTTGEWINKDVDKSDFFEPTGVCTWKILDGATCEPVA